MDSSSMRMTARPHFSKTVFDNGLTLLSERRPEFRSLAIGFWVKAGTRHESPSQAGISHFLEHMLFKGTSSRTALDIAREVDRVGGEFNAFTTREYTCFHILLLDRDVGLGLDILSDVVLNSSFDPDELERERKVILQEISMMEESPEELVYDFFLEMAYKRHGLGRPILGTQRSVRRIRRAELLKFFRHHYRPDQIVISVAGNVSHDVLKRSLKSLIKNKWPGRSSKISGSFAEGLGHPVPVPQVWSGNAWIERPTEQVHLIWGVEALPYTAQDRFAAFLLNTYLGGGMSSTLFQEIREKNALAYTVYSNLSSFSDSGLFTVYAATGMTQVSQCVKLIQKCIGQLKEDLLTRDHLQMVKENLKGTVLLSSDSVEARMSSLAKGEMFHKHHLSAQELCKQIDHVTAEDIRRVARKLFLTDRSSILCLGPKPSRVLKEKLKPVLLKR